MRALANVALGGIVSVWLLIAIVVVGTGVLSAMPAWATPAILLGLVSAVLLPFWRYRPFREWSLATNVKTYVAIHVSRFVGFYFLVLNARGELPEEFVVGGWGDIIVACGAVAVVLYLPRAESFRWWSLLAWNVIGLADILLVVGTAARLFFFDPESVSVLREFPLGLLPTFLVPIIISTHIVMLVGLQADMPALVEDDQV